MDKNTRTGWLCGLGAYSLWGVLPIYWKQLYQVDAFEILANRFIWSLLFVLGLIICTGKWQEFVAETKVVFSTCSSSFRMLLAAVMIACNWGIFIWAVGDGRIVETSMGYYINPLMNVCLGTIFLKESLNKLEWIAVACATCGISYMVFQLGSLPWVSITVPLSFAIYGLLKKKIFVSPFTSVLLETLIISPIAIYFLGSLWTKGSNAFQLYDWKTALFLMGCGVVTATPLLLFTGCAKRLPLSLVGFMQYLSPTMSLLIGVFIYGEAFTTTHGVTFGCIWVGLIFFIISQLKKL